MKLLFIILMCTFSQQSFYNSLTDFYSKGCELTGFYSKWFIVSKLSDGQYDVSVSMGRYKPMKKAIINLKTIQFSKKGEIGPYIFLKKTAVKKMKLKDGFDTPVTVYNESLECKEHYLTNISFIQGSNPKSPELEKRILMEDKKKEEQKRKEKNNTKMAKILKKEKDQLRKIVTLKGIKKFKASGCRYVEKYAWKVSYDGNIQPPKHFVVESPDGRFAMKVGSRFVKDSGKMHNLQNYTKPVHLYAESSLCKSIINKHRSKSERKRRLKKKQKESLYD